jgi:hypothetical protein
VSDIVLKNGDAGIIIITIKLLNREEDAPFKWYNCE